MISSNVIVAIVSSNCETLTMTLIINAYEGHPNRFDYEFNGYYISLPAAGNNTTAV
jgi:hypothetical protein